MKLSYLLSICCLLAPCLSYSANYSPKVTRIITEKNTRPINYDDTYTKGIAYGIPVNGVGMYGVPKGHVVNQVLVSEPYTTSIGLLDGQGKVIYHIASSENQFVSANGELSLKNGQRIVYGTSYAPTIGHPYNMTDGTARIWLCDDTQKSCQTVNLPEGDYYQNTADKNISQFSQVVNVGPQAEYAIVLFDLWDIDFASNPNFENSDCGSDRCHIIAKSVRQSDGSYSKPVPLYSGSHSCFIGEMHFNSNATSLVASACRNHDNYVITHLDGDNPGVRKLNNSLHGPYPVGISDDNTIAFAYNDDKTNSLCVVEYNVDDFIVDKPSSCVTKIHDKLDNQDTLPGYLKNIQYLEDSHTAVVTDSFDWGNGVIYGDSDSGRKFTPINQYLNGDIAKFDGNGITMVSGNKTDLTIGFTGAYFKPVYSYHRSYNQKVLDLFAKITDYELSPFFIQLKLNGAGY